MDNGKEAKARVHWPKPSKKQLERKFIPIAQHGTAVLVFVCFATGPALQTIAIRGQTMAVAYIAVLGFEAITAFGLRVFLLKEGSSVTKLAGIVLLRNGNS
jgi:multidrug transporter EmrE-like cation transporter